MSKEGVVEGQASYQGSVVELQLNAEAAHQLREALEGLHWSWSPGRSVVVPLRLPDDRTLHLRVIPTTVTSAMRRGSTWVMTGWLTAM